MYCKNTIFIPLLLVLGSTAGAQTWNLTNDFSPPSNPNGAWSYAEYAGGTFENLTWQPTAGVYAVGPVLQDGAFIYKNTTGSPAYGIDPGQISLESDWGTAVARWTAPTTGIYDINVAIGGTTATEGGGYGNNFAQYGGLNIGLVSQADTSFTNNVKTWTLTDVHLTGGQTVDAFVANPGYANGGNTQTSFTVAAVPEPAQFAVVGFGILGLLIRRRRA